MLQKNFIKKSIGTLKITPEYVRSGKTKLVKITDSSNDVSIEDLNSYRKLSNLAEIKSFKENFYSFSEELNIKNDCVRWDLLLGNSLCKDHEAKILRDIKYSIDKFTSYHTDILERRKILYENLIQISGPDGSDLEIPIYSHNGVTGRTTIKKGYNFLTSKKDFRKGCKSNKKNKFLVSVDFKACEPNLYLRAIGKNISNPDIYEFLSSELGLETKDRSTLKRGILSVLYGASDSTSSKILGSKRDSLRKIKEFFRIEETTAYLKEEFKRSNTIYNLYGRPIHSDKSILNKWIQSSAVDFCSLAFLNFVEEFNLSACYLVHDDMVIEADKDQYNKIKNKKDLFEPKSNLSLPVEITVLST
jgi:hypothetical protein